MANNKQCPTCGQDYPKYSTNKEVNETPIEELIEKHTGMKYEDYLKHKEAEKQRIWRKYSPD
tara:strand:- start:830 stop:1015 length:186 start_codon:yes stop_codon:yes gene_type:complete